MANPPRPAEKHALIIPAQHVKAVKTFLEEHRVLDKSRKITPYSQPNPGQEAPVDNETPQREERFVVPFLSVLQDTATSSPVDEEGLNLEEQHLGPLASQLQSILGPETYKNIRIITLHSSSLSGASSSNPPTNPLRAAFHAALSTLPAGTLDCLALTPDQLAADLPSTYSIYPPLLLLPAHAFARASWTALITHHGPLTTSATFAALFAHVARALGVTHIATNAPIAASTNLLPANRAPEEGESEGEGEGGGGGERENVLRSPTGLTPLHGPFGPRLAPHPLHFPTARDFSAAFWATARQNGVAQTWAPRYTMFSRGNVKEKARLLGLPSVRQAVREGDDADATAAAGGGGGGGGGGGCSAVDLYAGIGYFAFSYRKAGVRKVVGWEINAWSVEGLRRGAGVNGWGVRVVGQESEDEDAEAFLEEKDFVVFLESNVHAAARVERMRARLPPVRHVNAGLLPTSRGGWETAVRVLDPERGGWVHLHENFGETEVDVKAGEVLDEVKKLWEVIRAERCGSDAAGLDVDDEVEGVVRLEHVERVKTYAPGVLHCVLDIWISPTGTNTKAEKTEEGVSESND